MTASFIENVKGMVQPKIYSHSCLFNPVYDFFPLWDIKMFKASKKHSNIPL